MDASFRDWAGLPVHIVDLIVTMLDGFSDYLRFCGVCQQWRYVALDANLDFKVKLKVLKASQRKLPMLMFMTYENNERSLFSVSDRITYDIKFPLPYKSRFVGSSCGWLFCLDRTMVLTLVNPWNNSCISLPVFKDPHHLFREEWRKKFFDFYIKKGILFSDASVSSKGFGVLVIYGAIFELALFNYGEPSWNFIKSEENGYQAADIICYKGKLYAVDWYSKLVEIDTASKTIKTIVPTNDRSFDCPNIAYLVESQDGELLMVKRFWLRSRHDEDHPAAEGASDDDDVYDDDYLDHLASLEISSSDTDSESSDRDFDDSDFPRSFEFEVFKMTQPNEEGSATWEKINNIGKQALFVGDNHSVSVSTVEFPKCLPNSIYFTSQHHYGLLPYSCRGVNEDSFIYNLEDKRFFCHHMLEESLKYMQPPIWFVPNPLEINLD